MYAMGELPKANTAQVILIPLKNYSIAVERNHVKYLCESLVFESIKYLIY